MPFADWECLESFGAKTRMNLQFLKIDRIHIKTQAIITAVRGASTNRIPNVNALFPKQIYQLFVTALGKTLRGHLNVILARLDAEPVHQSVH